MIARYLLTLCIALGGSSFLFSQDCNPKLKSENDTLNLIWHYTAFELDDKEEKIDVINKINDTEGYQHEHIFVSMNNWKLDKSFVYDSNPSILFLSLSILDTINRCSWIQLSEAKCEDKYIS